MHNQGQMQLISSLGHCGFLLASLVLVCKFSLCSSGIADENENVQHCGCLGDWLRTSLGCYKVFRDQKTWDEADQFCQTFQNEGHLGVFKNDHELSVYHYLLGHQMGNPVWVGASDKDGDGKWEWTDKSVLDIENIWAAGEPDNSGEKLCAYLYLEDDFRKLKTGRCDTPMVYVCWHPSIYYLHNAWY